MAYNFAMDDTTAHPTRYPNDDRLKVLFITEDDPLYVIRFFEVFFAEYPRDEFNICAITVADVFHEPIWKTAWRMLRFYGMIDFMRLSLRFIRVKLSGRNITSLAEDAGIESLPTASVNAPGYVDKVRNLKPDVIVSVAAPEIFKADILSVARLRCINIHSGRLPRYRGMMPNFWQLLNGEPCATITVHDMVSRLDAGDVLGTREFPLRERDSLDRVITHTKQEGARLMIDVLQRIAGEEIAPVALDMGEAHYYSFPKPADVKTFRRRGHRML